VSMKLYEWEPEADRRREDAVRPGPPHFIAARKTAQLLGLDLGAPPGLKRAPDPPLNRA